MTPPHSDDPAITRFALDDLPSADHQAMEEWINQDPLLQSEVQDLRHLAETLKAEAPIHQLRLTPMQRKRATQPPLRKPLPSSTPRSSHYRPARRWTLPASLLRIAALIALLATAFWLGHTTYPHWAGSPNIAQAASPRSNPIPTLVPEPLNPVQPPTVSSVTPTSEPASQPVTSPALLATKSEAPSPQPAPPSPPSLSKPNTTPEPAVLVGTTEPRTKPAKAQTALAYGITAPGMPTLFTNASRTTTDTLPLHPRLIRPALQPNGNRQLQLQAKPLAPGTKPAPGIPQERRKPDLFIHSWSAEVASCPWNPRLRLIRIAIQLPADQEAVTVGNPDYPLEVAFNPSHVREFRRLCTRHFPSPEKRLAGTQVVWYEFQPNGAPASSADSGKHIALVRLPSARFTTQTVGPFDASRLQVLDRGQTWQQAREDFVFDSAVVALDLLLSGGAQGSTLNQHLVLDLARAGKGKDPDGSRGRFISTLQQVSQLTRP
jgi:hypothetical protein